MKVEIAKQIILNNYKGETFRLSMSFDLVTDNRKSYKIEGHKI